ncbi:hypothetical protein BX600DRAFT_374124 [Xylariales sp. PMI_506]|nr:hypothetical protein BX600DRAFT_374124 [Xylariales sp. PMI_506]
MEPSPSMFDAIMYPTALFAKTVEDPNSKSAACPFEASQLNPKNRPNSLDLPKRRSWRIDGGESNGIRFFAIPSFAIGRPPLRIDVFLSVQMGRLSELRHTLELPRAHLVGGSELERLGISRIILQRLQSWYDSTPGLEVTYMNMPFGSRIILEQVGVAVDKALVHLVPNYDIERQWLAKEELQAMWQLPSANWPPAIDHSDLQLVSQMHEAISIVRLAHFPQSETFVFKSASTDMKYLYHELKMLLTMRRHPHIILPPVYVVTKKCLFGGKTGVCGFIQNFFPLGTLRDALSQKLHGLSISLQDRVRWARQLVSALIHIQSAPTGFYTDLKPNNILLHQYRNGTGILLVDFEQRNSWYTWSPPEVYYVEYLENLASSHPDHDSRGAYSKLLQSYIPGWQQHDNHTRYSDSTFGFSKAWISLSLPEREAAQVFMLGKILWCIFEGVPFPNSCVTPETFLEAPCDQSFPEFRKTPPLLRECIRQCTAGAPEWDGRLPYVVRSGDKLFPRGRAGQAGELEGICTETQEHARLWWQNEVADAQRFLTARVRRRNNIETQRDAEILTFMDQRPSLQNVEEILERFERILSASDLVDPRIA